MRKRWARSRYRRNTATPQGRRSVFVCTCPAYLPARLSGFRLPIVALQSGIPQRPGHDPVLAAVRERLDTTAVHSLEFYVPLHRVPIAPNSTLACCDDLDCPEDLPGAAKQFIPTSSRGDRNTEPEADPLRDIYLAEQAPRRSGMYERPGSPKLDLRADNHGTKCRSHAARPGPVPDLALPRSYAGQLHIRCVRHGSHDPKRPSGRVRKPPMGPVRRTFKGRWPGKDTVGVRFHRVQPRISGP